MIKTVSAFEARTKLGELMNEVYYTGVEFIIERMGKPTAKLVPVSSKPDKKLSKDYMKFAGLWANEDGKIIGRYARKLRKKAKLILPKSA